MQTVLITGGTGLVGKALTKLLLGKGYRVIVLTRDVKKQTGINNLQFAKWDVSRKEIDLNAIEQADYIVHLAGAGVMDNKWTPEYKKEIVDSRVKSGELITETLQQHSNKVQAVVSASAIGWYKENDALHVEDEPADDSFLGSTCQLWEQSTQTITQLGKRLVSLRIGIVLSPHGGALKEFMQPLKFGVAGILGSGKQTVSWVHIDDLCRMFLFAIENEKISGVYNAVAPEPVNNKTLTLTLAKKMKKFFIPLHVPTFMLKIMLGSRSIEVLKSSNVSSKKIEAAGFDHQFKNIDAALADLVAN
jgi:uncharacterized protein